MRVNLKSEFIWSDIQQKYILLRNLSINWTGEVLVCKGASSQQTDIANQQQQFYSTLTNDYNQQFSQQSNILGSLKNSLDPIVQAGPNQYGFSGGETNALNSSAIQGTGQQYANASRNLKQQQAAQGGGNTLLPSGVASQQAAGLAAAGANNTSNALLGVQQAGYAQGHQQYENAIGQLGGVASQYNPTGFAGSANSAGSSAYGSAQQNQTMNNAASPWNVLGGVLGGVASQFGSIGKGLSGGLSSAQSPYGYDPLGEMSGSGSPFQSFGGMSPLGADPTPFFPG